MTPKSRAGRYSLNSAIETRNGSRVWEATSNGPAEIATPSPMLLTTAAARTPLNPFPSRVGETASMMPEGRRRTGGRIAIAPGASSLHLVGGEVATLEDA